LLYSCSLGDSAVCDDLITVGSGARSVQELEPFAHNTEYANASQCLPPESAGEGSQTVAPQPAVVVAGEHSWIISPWQSPGGGLQGVRVEQPPHNHGLGRQSDGDVLRPTYTLNRRPHCKISAPTTDPLEHGDSGAAAALWQLGDSSRSVWWGLSDGVAMVNTRDEIWVWRERPVGENEVA